ncbi:hypothetical protein IGB42_00118 [Andreprevotia sp. IGB-42]|uniref:rhamnan synthesis F family protein n=1 Tax=Andreprevotia sp. IGB-42 TaxID=2497473 RepID=UPI0013586ABF|nr:rhamnan synthesis F family protein [Andreprevotia sp. IGB-42]KAF0815041.1 hypothetical protein IGB42_00118 [Andreprevotia sp. IGB-42]
MTESTRPEITFFFTDNCERQTVEPIAQEAQKRGFPVRFSSDLRERAVIGIYCQHACRPNASFSMIMLHDLAQRHDIWPHFWMHEPWNEFDVGILPGEAWVQRWRSQGMLRVAQPRLGVFDIGWPKADLIYRNRDEFAVKAQQLRETLGLKHEKTVLYAPSWENHGKQDDFVRSLMDMPVNLLLKQAPWAPSYTQVWENIRKMNALHQGIADNVHIVDPEISIMYCIGISDLLVSDESSVLIEASLYEVPSVAVSDWLIPDREPPRFASVPFDHVRKTTRAQLRDTVEAILADPLQARRDAAQLRDFHFSHFGQSAQLAVDLIESAVDGIALTVAPLGLEAAPQPLPVAAPAPAAAQSGPYHFNTQLRIFERQRSGNFAYNDGDQVENRLYDIVTQAKDVSVGSDELFSRANDWPTFYHLSPARANLMRPIEHNLQGKSVLELGSGCGAISRFLGEAGCTLTCVEGSRRRAAITASRCRDLPNVKVFNDNFQDFQPEELFDVVTLIGVLEYSRVFIKGDDPIATALALAQSFLKPDGVLIVAIENKLGLKYWAGAPEDHISIPFFGLESLYGSNTAVTFGRRELERVLKKAHFSETEFYYPYPDYKLPNMVLTERANESGEPGLYNLLAAGAAPNQALEYARTFSEGAVYRGLLENGLLGDLANSFLVIAKKGAGNWQFNQQDLAFVYSTGRRKPLSKEVRIVATEQGTVVRRRLLHAQQKPAWMKFAREEPLLPGELLFNQLLPIVNREGWGVEELVQWVRPFVQVLEQKSKKRGARRMVPGELLDASPFNLIENQGKYTLFDLEWQLWDEIDLALPLFRGLFHSLNKLGTVAPPRPGTPTSIVDLSAAIAERVGVKVDVDALLAQDVEFQRQVVVFCPAPANFRAAHLDIRIQPTQLKRAYLKGQSAAAPHAQAVVQPPAQPDGRIAVVCHIYHEDLWPAFVEVLRRLPTNATFFFTTVTAKAPLVQPLLERDFPGAMLVICENRGRDVGPLFTLLKHARLEDFRYVLKIHTKKSPHLDNREGADWLRTSLTQLVPDHGVEALLSTLDAKPEVGLVGPAGMLLSAQLMIGRHGENYPGMKRWAKRFDYDLDEADYSFVAGTMFWARGAIFGVLRELGVQQSDFESEAGQLDGTLAHVMERMFPLAARRCGLTTTSIDALPLPKPVEEETLSSYAQWLSGFNLSTEQGHLFDALIESWPSRPNIMPVLVDRAGDMAALIQGIKTFSKQLYASDHLLIATPLPVPPGGAGSNVHWLQYQGDPAAALNAAVAQLECDWLYVVPAGDVLQPETMLFVAQHLMADDRLRVLYTDEDVLVADGQVDNPSLFPDINVDWLRSRPYIGDAFAISRASWLKVGGLDSEHGVWAGLDLIWRVFEQEGMHTIGHIPQILRHAQAPLHGRWHVPEIAQAAARVTLAHLTRCGIGAQVHALQSANRVLYQHSDQPLVSILVPTKDQLPVLRRCLESLLEKTTYPNYELIVIDNNSETEDAIGYLNGLVALGSDRVRVLRYPEPFNFSAINNAAASEARGDYLVLLNNDTAITQPDWLENLLNHAQRPEVGIVGAKLLYPDGRIQHGGVVLGLRGPADHPFIGMPGDAEGYMFRMLFDQNYSAVTAACLMIRKSVYFDVAGMDEEAFKVSYNDVDLCLKVHQAGYLAVWTPHAVLMHEGSVSQTQIDPAKQEAKRKRFQGEQDAMLHKWLPLLARDPAYNKNLSLNGNGFEIEPRSLLTWQPLTWRPVPVVVAHPADSMGCGQYRVIQPFMAMAKGERLTGGMSWELLNPLDLERIAPDVLVLQRQITDDQFQFMSGFKKFSSAFKVYELDDYLPNLPIKSVHRAHMPKDIMKALRRALTQVDRFVVSTGPLAEAYAGLHPDIRVIENRLPVDWWSGVQSQRRVGRKPRVGWGGGSSHTGDLELITSVVKELANEVEWVFLGMCPEVLKPYVHEFHSGVPIAEYPAKLASLNLDLAVAPLEHNQFNDCKSNLRLLEYGICGFPVVCTDIVCYRGDLPVTLVKNRHKDWVEAIREHLADLDATAARGDALKQAVLQHWMLEGDHLDAWRKAWLPD